MNPLQSTPEGGSADTPSHRPLWAQIVSDVFSPLTIPTIAMALALWATPMRSVPDSHRLIATLLVGVITGIVPLAAIAAMISTGMISDRAVSRREQRVTPMIVGALCYFGAALFVSSLGAPAWLSMFFKGASAATVAALLITLRWKISAHTTAVGGLAGMMMWFAVSGLADINIMIMLSAGILLAGAVATARLLLRRHTPAQVLAGLALGFTFCFGAMYIA